MAATHYPKRTAHYNRRQKEATTTTKATSDNEPECAKKHHIDASQLVQMMRIEPQCCFGAANMTVWFRTRLHKLPSDVRVLIHDWAHNATISFGKSVPAL
jgi:hypothetical protein